jgi:PAS domain S-box-containing protein
LAIVFELSPGDPMLALLDAIGDGVAVHDARGKLVYRNSAAEALCDLSKPGALVVIDEAGRSFALDELFAATSPAERLLRFSPNDGSHDRWARVFRRAVAGPGGVSFTVTTLRDLTDRVTAAERAIFDSIGDPFSILDRELRIVHVNQAAARMVGQKPADLIGKRIWDVVPEAKDSPTHRAYEKVLATGQSLEIEDYVPVFDRWFETSIHPVAGGLSVYSKDVTVRRRALDLTMRLARHNTLRADIVTALSEEREIPRMLDRVCEALVDNLEAAFARVWTLDEAGTMLLLQASAGIYTHVNGPHKAVPVGKFKIGRIAASKKAHLTNDVQSDPQVGNPEWAREQKMVAFAGYPLVVDDRVVGVMAMFSRKPLPEDTTSALGSIADTIAQGIERRRAEIELAQRVVDLARSNAELEQFAYVASHDLQEPLRMIASYNQLLARRYKGKLGEDADEFIAFTVEGVTRMQRLINDLLAYSRIGTRGKEADEIDLEEIVTEAKANLAKAIEESAAEIVVPGALPRVLGDRSQIGQLVQNLLGNAIKFRRDVPPRVEITAHRQGAWCQITVADNGLGIEEQYFERIFVIFQRLNAREDYPGTGIGLALCKKIVERHGGKIWLRSIPGSGTTMLFTLPAVPGDHL